MSNAKLSLAQFFFQNSPRTQQVKCKTAEPLNCVMVLVYLLLLPLFGCCCCYCFVLLLLFFFITLSPNCILQKGISTLVFKSFLPFESKSHNIPPRSHSKKESSLQASIGSNTQRNTKIGLAVLRTLTPSHNLQTLLGGFLQGREAGIWKQRGTTMIRAKCTRDGTLWGVMTGSADDNGGD